MDTSKFQSSFIPKKPLAGIAVQQEHTPINIFAVIGVVVLVASISAALGSFLWVKYLTKQVEVNKDTLARTREAFSPSVIKDLERVSKRIEAAREVLNNHVAFSNIFNIISGITLKNVRFTSLTYAFDPKGVRITMSGEAESFTAVALQSDVFSAAKVIRDPIVSNLGLKENGAVTFQFTGTLETDTFKFKGVQVNTSTSSLRVEAPTATSTATTTRATATTTNNRR